MKTFKKCLALVVLVAVAAVSGCKKDEVAPSPSKTIQKKTMDGGGPITPPQLPPHP